MNDLQERAERGVKTSKIALRFAVFAVVINLALTGYLFWIYMGGE